MIIHDTDRFGLSSTQLVELKTHPEPFQAIWDGLKLVELRREDRVRFEVGAHLYLREYFPDKQAHSDRAMLVRVQHCQRGYGLPDDMVAMSIKVCGRFECGRAARP